MKLAKRILFFLLIVQTFQSFGQNKKEIDSLFKAHDIKISNGKLQKFDTLKLTRMADYLMDNLYTKTKLVDTVCTFISKDLLNRNLKGKNTDILARYQIGQGNANILLGNYDKSLNAFSSVLGNSQINAKHKAKAEANIGIVHYQEENYALAAKHYLSSIEYCKKNNITYANQLVNLCLIYQNLKNINKQLEYANEGMEYAKNIKDTVSLAYIYNILGLAYKELKDLDKAKYYLEEAIILGRLTDTDVIIADANENLGIIYKSTKNYNKGEKHLKEALEYNIKMDRNNFTTYSNLAHLYSNKGEMDKAKLFFEKADASIDENITFYLKQDHYFFKSEYFKKLGKYKEAYFNLSQCKMYMDSMTIETSLNEVRNLEQEYAIREMRLSDSLEFAIKEKNIQEKNKLSSEKKNAQLKFQRGVMGFSIAFILLLLISILYVFRMYRNKRLANEVIASQKSLVEKQKMRIEEKNKELTDSINYAKNLQDAVIPSLESLQAQIGHIGLLYLPKDIVSGDFYWSHQTSDSLYFAVADCTGHGVPGAMMSLVGINGLERCVKEYNLKEPAEILNQLSSHVEDTFSNHSYGINDGMDISLIRFDYAERTLTFAGAYNPLWIFSPKDVAKLSKYSRFTDEDTFYSIPADKQPIGKFRDKKPFAQHTIELPVDATIVLLSDGFADQFGGEKEKKFKYQNLRQIINANLSKKPQDLANLLKLEFTEWKQNLEQVDDVTLVILKLNE